MDVITKCIAAAVTTKNRNWDDAGYKRGVVGPYRLLQEIKAEAVKEGVPPTIEQVREALGLLKKILAAKIIPSEEQKDLFNEIFDKTDTVDVFKDFFTSI